MSDLEMKALVKFGEEYKQYATVNGQANPSATTHQQMQKLFGNWSDMLERLVANMWQPNTAYELNQVVWTPSMPANMVAICTNAGSSGAAEPSWPTIVNDTVTDGAVVWSMVTEVITGESPLGINQGGTGANNPVDARSNLGITSKIGINPTGTIIAYAANGDIPDGYLPCNGAAVSRTTYDNLFGVIGTLYGEGDGINTFNLPDLTDRFLEGSSTAGNVVNAGLPNITGNANKTVVQKNSSRTGVFAGSPSMIFDHYVPDSSPNAVNQVDIVFDASLSNAIFGNSETVQPPSVTMIYLVKYQIYTAGNMMDAGLPNIEGSFKCYSYGAGDAKDAFSSVVNNPNILGPGGSAYYNFVYFELNAQSYNNIYGGSNTVQPSAVTTQYLIKY